MRHTEKEKAKTLVAEEIRGMRKSSLIVLSRNSEDFFHGLILGFPIFLTFFLSCSVLKSRPIEVQSLPAYKVPCT